MMTSDRVTVLGSRPIWDYASFKSFLDIQEELFVESMQDAAELHRDMLSDMSPYELHADIGTEMEQWWEEQIGHFRSQLAAEYRKDQRRRLKRKLRLETTRRQAVEDQLQSANAELQQTRDSLSATEEVLAYFMEEWRCRKCNAEWDL